jgi:hypothetical protein
VNSVIPDSDATTYVTAVLTLCLGLPETPLHTSAQDQRYARQLFDRGVPVGVVESAFLLASLRRLLRPADASPLSSIRSLAYFQPVIEELSKNYCPTPPPKTIWSTCGSSSKTSPETRAPPPRTERQRFKKLRFQMIANSQSSVNTRTGRNDRGQKSPGYLR